MLRKLYVKNLRLVMAIIYMVTSHHIASHHYIMFQKKNRTIPPWWQLHGWCNPLFSHVAKGCGFVPPTPPPPRFDRAATSVLAIPTVDSSCAAAANNNNNNNTVAVQLEEDSVSPRRLQQQQQQEYPRGRSRTMWRRRDCGTGCRRQHVITVVRSSWECVVTVPPPTFVGDDGDW